MVIKRNALYLGLNPLGQSDIVGVTSVAIINRAVEGKNMIALVKSDGSYSERRTTRILKNNIGYYIRTPAILLNFVGKNVRVEVNRIDSLENEICSIIPEDFIIGNKVRVKSWENDPYFTSSFSLVIPHKYINTHCVNGIVGYRVDLSRITKESIIDGFFYIYFSKGYSSLSVPLKQFGSYLRTRQLQSVKDMFLEKDINNFSYLKTIESELSDYGIMIFKEGTDAGS